MAKHRKLTRNALIRKAVKDLLENETHSQEWSEAVLQQGDGKFAPFESHRAKLDELMQDPFG
ncbi:MAG TPA: hypothetical protein VHW71_07935 [Steroidobacteraceae bacterium]|jgi:hypothetical protein|nr:hypothetical protein [Steroidobacteraceae bacterium]